MGILKELYDGEVYPSESIVYKSKEYKDINREIVKLQEQLEKELPPDQWCKVLEMKELIDQRSAITEYTNFAYGFKIGMRLANAVCSEEV